MEFMDIGLERKVVVDMDGTICRTNGVDYTSSVPIIDRIKELNEQYYNKGYTIIIDTARGYGILGEKQRQRISLEEEAKLLEIERTTHLQLTTWGVKYHQLRIGKKVAGGLYIDDRAINASDFFVNSSGCPNKKNGILINNKEYVPYVNPYFIAEVGINHNGSEEIARQLIDMAARCGANAVKFQKRDIERCFTPEQLDSPYLHSNSFGKTYREHKNYLEFGYDQLDSLYKYTKSKHNIDFLITAFDVDTLHQCYSMFKMPAIKIASPFVNDVKYIEECRKIGKPLIVSTGMHDFKEVESMSKILNRYLDTIWIVLQCTTSYPTANEDVNMNVLDSYKKLSNFVGYSGHDIGVISPLVAATKGAVVIEKHITLDRTMKGPDHVCSLEERGLYLSIKYMKTGLSMLGSNTKKVLLCEENNRSKYSIKEKEGSDNYGGYLCK